MALPNQSLSPEAEALIALHGGPVTVPGAKGDYVVMRPDVYAAMLGLSDDDEAETLAAVRRGLDDLAAGRTQDLEEVFDELNRA